jgi:hypothetical protein
VYAYFSVERMGVPEPPATWRFATVGLGAGVMVGASAEAVTRVKDWTAARAATRKRGDEESIVLTVEAGEGEGWRKKRRMWN